MKTLIPIILIIAGIFYVITPYNLLPSFIPVIGWIDDIAVTALMIYYMKYGRLPDFINRFLGRVVGENGTRGRGGASYGGYRSKEDARSRGQSGSAGAGPRGRSPYDILGVSPNATQQEIHAAYRKLAQQYNCVFFSYLWC